MRIAILGGTSQIARDLVQSLGSNGEFVFSLYGRRPEAIRRWMQLTPSVKCDVGAFEDFRASASEFDGIINFVGSGNPAKVEQLGSSILDITYYFDSLALQYLKQNPGCRYIFLSSGAIYGGGFASPAEDYSSASFAINQLDARDWYGLAKMYAEVRHRSLTDLHIVDLRVFNYFSYSADIEARFLITDALRAIRDRQVFQTSQENIVRDYVGPQELSQLIRKILKAPHQNVAVDCFTREPVDKLSMLDRMRAEFDLRYELVERRTGLMATGGKLNYYSNSRKASDLFGYAPEETSMEVVLDQAQRLLAGI